MRIEVRKDLMPMAVQSGVAVYVLWHFYSVKLR